MDMIDSNVSQLKLEVSPSPREIREQLFWCWRLFSDVAASTRHMAEAMATVGMNFDEDPDGAVHEYIDCFIAFDDYQRDLVRAVEALPAVNRTVDATVNALEELAELRAQRGSRRRRRRRRRPEAREVAGDE